MPNKMTPDLRVYCYPREAIKLVKGRSIDIYDPVGERHADGSFVNDADVSYWQMKTPTAPPPYYANRGFVLSRMDTLLPKDGGAPPEAGVHDFSMATTAMTLQEENVVLDTTVGSIGDITAPSRNWKIIQPEKQKSLFKVVVPEKQPFSWIEQTSHDNISWQAQMVDPLEKNQGFVVHVHKRKGVQGTSKSTAASGYFYLWWDNWALLFQEGLSYAAFLRMETDKNGATAWRWMATLPFNPAAIPAEYEGVRTLKIAVWYQFGGLAVSLNAAQPYYVANHDLNTGSQLTINVASAPLSIGGVGVAMSWSTSRVVFAPQARFSRKFASSFMPLLGDKDFQSAYGYVPIGFGASHSVTLQSASPSPGTLQYTCLITATENGHESACVKAVRIAYKSKVQTTSLDPIDIRPALTGTTTEESAEPPQMDSSQWRLELSRHILPDLPAPGGGSVGMNWQNYVKQYNPIVIYANWLMDDGTYQKDPWVQRLDGYITIFNPNTPGYNDLPLSLVASDPVIRLQEPSAIIDESYAPLDLLFHADTMAAQATKGYHAVEMLLNRTLGFIIGRNLKTFFRPAHYGLFNTDGRIYQRGVPPQGIMWLPPWKQGVINWIKQVAEYDIAVFAFRSLPPGTTINTVNAAGEITGTVATSQWTVFPIYGHLWEVLDNLPISTVTVTDYLDSNYIIESAQTVNLPQVDYNVFKLIGRVPGASDFGPILAPRNFIQTGSNPFLADGGGAAETWDRTLMMELPIDGAKSDSEAILAAQAISMSRQRQKMDLRKVTVHTRGIVELFWGDKVITKQRPQLSDGVSMAGLDIGELAGKTFRAIRISNSWTWGSHPDMVSTLHLGDVNTFGDIVAMR